MKSLLPSLPALMTLTLVAFPFHLLASAERESYLRGERVEWNVPAEPGNEVTFAIGSLFREKIPAGKNGQAHFTFDTSALRPGAYELTVEGRESLCRNIYIGPSIRTDTIPLYRWGHVDETMDFAWYQARGFSGGTSWVMTDPEEPGSQAYERRMKLLDLAARQGFSVGFYLHPLWSKSLIQQDAARVLMKNGKRVGPKVVWPVDPLTAPAREHAAMVVESFIRSYAWHPAIRYSMLSSEQRPLPGVSPELMKMANAELPFDFSTTLQSSASAFRQVFSSKGSIIPDQHPDYLARKWFYERGHGTALLNEEMARRIRKGRPDMLISHEPWRVAPTRDTAKGLDLIGSWTYAYGDLKRLMFAHFLRAPGRKEKQGIQPILSLFVYANMVMSLKDSRANMTEDNSGGDPFFTASPDYAREALWIYLSLRPEEIAVYWAGALPPDDPALNPQITSPETFTAMGEFVRDILRPYGPAIHASSRGKAPVALLSSAAATWFTSHELDYNVNEAALPYASLLVMNDVPFDLLLDDDIMEGGLDGYRALIIPFGNTLTQTMSEQIRRFAENGGKVITNEALPVNIPGITQTSFDFEPLRRQDGRAALKGQPMITAEEARTMMENYAAQLEPLVKEWRGPVSSPSRRVIINSLDAGHGRYDFIINDDRAYGPRFGNHKLHFENGVEQQARVRFDTAEYPVLYDILSRKKLDAPAVPGSHYSELTLTLPPAQGRIILALPEEIASVNLTGPETLQRGHREALRIQIIGTSGQPMHHAHPIHVRILDGNGEETGWSRHITTTPDGSASLDFTPAWNDAPGPWRIEATDFAAGKTAVIHPKME